MINTLTMLKLNLSLKAFLLFTVVLLGIVTRMMIGYTVFTNPIHRYAGPTIRAATSQQVDYTDAKFHAFKMRRKVALETPTHFPQQFSVQSFSIELVLISTIELQEDQLNAADPTPRLRPPAHV